MIPWWKSRTIQWATVTLLLWCAVFVAMMFGIDVNTMVEKAVAATGAVTTLLTILGRVTTTGTDIDPAKVLPGLSSPAVESVIDGLREARSVRDNRVIE